MKKKLLIIGAGSVGGHIAFNTQQYGLDKYEIIGFLDDNPKKIDSLIFGLPVLGPVEYLLKVNVIVNIVIGIAFPSIKKNIIQRINTIGSFEFPTLIAKSAWISNNVSIGEGTIIYPGVSINYGSQIGSFVVMNMNCAIGHDCKIGDYSSLAPGVNLGGNSKIGSCVDLGIGSATKQDIEIGDNSIIGGQSMIIQNAPSNSKIVGVPGKIS
jgi:sugar O-acyltransferase (sialic acid O-acetyltransferase NeuD family)